MGIAPDRRRALRARRRAAREAPRGVRELQRVRGEADLDDRSRARRPAGAAADRLSALRAPGLQAPRGAACRNRRGCRCGGARRVCGLVPAEACAPEGAQRPAAQLPHRPDSVAPASASDEAARSATRARAGPAARGLRLAKPLGGRSLRRQASGARDRVWYGEGLRAGFAPASPPPQSAWRGYEGWARSAWLN